jgi:hypothetical protein
LKRGACQGPLTESWLKDLLLPFRGHVPVLAFGPDEQSQGLLLPLFQTPLLGEYQCLHHGQDVTEGLNLYRRQQQRRKRRPNAPPFEARCGLNQAQLKRLAPLYSTLNSRQRSLFHVFFWCLDDMQSSQWPVSLAKLLYRTSSETTAASVQFLITALEVLGDWSVRPKEYLAQLLPAIPVRSGLPDLGVVARQSKRLCRFWSRLATLPLSCLLPWAGFTWPVSTQALCALAGRYQMNTFSCLVQAHAKEKPVFQEIVRMVSHLELPVSTSLDPLTDPATVHEFLFSADEVPGTLRRAAWHLCMKMGLEHWPEQVRPFQHPNPPKTLPSPYLDLTLIPASADCQVVRYDRALQAIENLRQLYRFKSSPPLDPFNFDLRFLGESGQGVSIYTEILETLWSNAVERRYMEEVDDDQGAGLCISPTLSQDRQQELFALGFISGLCVRRGLHLPYPLHPDFWHYLQTTAGRSVTASFATRLERQVAQLAAVPYQEWQETWGLTVDTEEARQDLVVDHFLPPVEDLEAFRRGWWLFVHSLPLRGLYRLCNDMFCQRSQTHITAAALQACFQRRHERDDLFLRYLRILPEAQLSILLHFITGKRRLPWLQLGEEPICISWEGPPQSLPRAQNCTHTLMLPSHITNFLELIKTLNPIYQYATVYGFT